MNATITSSDITQASPEYDGLQDLLDTSTGGDKYELDTSGQVWSLDRNGQRKAVIHTNIAEHLDSIIAKNASKISSILDMSEDISTRPAIPAPWNFPTIAAFWAHFLAGGTNNAKDAIDLYFRPGAPVNAVRASSNSLKYDYRRTAGGPWLSMDILELMEGLYSARKISIGTIDDQATKIARKKEQAEKRVEKAKERAEKAVQNPTTGIANAETGSESNKVINHIGQITTALQAAKKNTKYHSGQYVFYGEKEDEILLTKFVTNGDIPPNGGAPVGADTYFAQYKDADNKIAWESDANIDVLARKINDYRLEAQKRKNQKEYAEIVDMGSEFSRVEFTKLCEAVAKSKGHRGEYKLNGKIYFVHERSSATPPAAFTSYSPKQFTVSYPGAGETKTTGDHLHINNTTRNNEDPTVENLIDFLEGHHGIYNSHHDKNRSVLLKSIKDFADNDDEIGHYAYKGTQYEMRKKTSILNSVGSLGQGAGYKYWADVPVGEHGTKEIGPFLTQEKFYQAIKKELDNAEHNHGAHADNGEHTKKGAEHPAEGGHKADAGHGDHGHKEEHGKDEGHHESHGFFDTAVHKIAGLFHSLGNGIIWGKNQVPEGIRKFGGATVKTAIEGAAIGGGAVVAASALLPGVTFAAAAAGFWPITLTSGAVIGGRKLYKWWKGGDEGGGHGGHH